jgi:hypothetical protein
MATRRLPSTGRNGGSLRQISKFYFNASLALNTIVLPTKQQHASAGAFLGRLPPLHPSAYSGVHYQRIILRCRGVYCRGKQRSSGKFPHLTWRFSSSCPALSADGIGNVGLLLSSHMCHVIHARATLRTHLNVLASRFLSSGAEICQKSLLVSKAVHESFCESVKNDKELIFTLL